MIRKKIDLSTTQLSHQCYGARKMIILRTCRSATRSGRVGRVWYTRSLTKCEFDSHLGITKHHHGLAALHLRRARPTTVHSRAGVDNQRHHTNILPTHAKYMIWLHGDRCLLAELLADTPCP